MTELRPGLPVSGKSQATERGGKEADSPRNVTLYGAVTYLKGNAWVS